MDQAELKKYLSYCEQTGQLSWLVARGRVSVGHIAGRVTDQGYLGIKLLGRDYKAHRLVWLYCHGSFPSTDIDHINGNRTDNRIENLRLATRSQNLANSKAKASSLSGLKGAYFDKRRNAWYGRLTFQGRFINLGRFNTPEEANAAYFQKAKELHGEFARAA